MSLTHLVTRCDVAQRLDALVPRYVRTNRAPMLVPRRSADASTIGTAYDYALRIELHARFPHAQVEAWTAEYATELLRLCPGLAGATSPQKTLALARRLVMNAKDFAEEHRVRRRSFAQVAAHSIRLAKIDLIAREHRIHETLAAAERDAVAELVALLKITPFESLGDAALLKLNPTFGNCAVHIGGADADLMAGHRMIEIKVRSSSCVERGHLRQLVGYVMLANEMHRLDGSMPRPREMCIYFARHAFLWSLPTEEMFAHPAYGEIERWLLSGAPPRKRPKMTELDRLRAIYRRPIRPS